MADHMPAAWADGLAAPTWSEPPVWLHGDLHPANLLARFLAAAGQPDEATFIRAQGWAVNLAMAMAAISADNPTMAAVARRTIANLTAGSEGPQVRKRLR